MQDLGTLGGADGAGRVINDLGQIAGISQTANGDAYHAFRWTAFGGMHDLGTLGGAASYVGPPPGAEGNSLFAMNRLGQIAGTSQTADGSYHAFRWTPLAGMRDLGTLGGANSYGISINDLGQVTGYSETADGSYHAFRWTRSGGMQDLGTFGGATSYGEAIDDLGQVVGEAQTAGGSYNAFRWTPSGGLQDLGTLGEPTSYGEAINDFGDVTGFVEQAEVETAFKWTPSGGMQALGTPQDLSTLPGLPSSFGVAINDLGQVAGNVFADFGEVERAFRWTAGGGTQDLGTLDPANSLARSEAGSINIFGEVTGSAETASGSQHAFLWSP